MQAGPGFSFTGWYGPEPLSSTCKIGRFNNPRPPQPVCLAATRSKWGTPRKGLCELPWSGCPSHSGKLVATVAWPFHGCWSPQFSRLEGAWGCEFHHQQILCQSLSSFRPQLSVHGSIMAIPVSLGSKRHDETVPRTPPPVFPARRPRLGCPSVGRAPHCLASLVVTTAS